MLEWLKTLYPVTDIIVEDIAAVTRKGAKRWNRSFSPLESGKRWFYGETEKQWGLTTLKGHETAELREEYGLKKTGHKTSDRWNAPHASPHFASIRSRRKPRDTPAVP